VPWTAKLPALLLSMVPTELLPSPQSMLVNIYPPGPALGSRRILCETPLLLGRSDECDIVISETTTSRLHARIQPRGGGGYEIIDLDSTNGSFVNNQSIERALLNDGDYLRIGNALFRYLAGGNVEADYHAEVYRLAILDGLTGLHNKRYFLDFLEREVVRSMRHGRALSLVLLDVDWFKSVNDEFGHLAGDQVLRDVAQRLRGLVHAEDLLARYGGEEFAAVLVEADHARALEVAEQFRDRMEAVPFDCDGTPYRLTISLGTATTLGAEPVTAADLIRRADENLYRAKHGGRNRLVSEAPAAAVGHG